MTEAHFRARWLRILVLCVVGVLLYLAIREKRDLTDFEVYRTAAERALSAAPLYRTADGHYQFKYLPAFAVVLSPMGRWPAEVAKAVWYAISFVCFVVLVRRSIDLLPERRLRGSWLPILTVVVLARFAVRELTLGQSNLLMALLLVMSLTAILERRAAAGIWAGLAVFVKPYAIVMLPWLAMASGVASVAAMVVVLAAGLALPAVVYGWHGNVVLLAGWARTVTDTTAPNLAHPDNVSLDSMWTKWLGAGSTASMAAVVSALVLVAVFLLVLARRRRVPVPTYLEFGWLMIAVPLLSPQGWDYVFLVAMPAICVLIDRWTVLPRPWQLASAAALAIFAFPFREALGAAAFESVMRFAIVSVAGLVVIGALTTLRLRDRG